jgi:myosin heavy subunit
METTSSMNQTTQSQRSNQDNPLKKWVIILGALAGLFLCSTLYLAFFAKPTTNRVYKEVENKNFELQSELDSLLAEHNRIKEQYGELSDQLSEKDSIIMANAAEIEKMINSQADYNRIKKQLARLQNISQEYVKEMDKLYQENKALKEENQQVRADLEQEREVTRTMQKSNEDLTQKISNAATFKAYNLKSGGYLVRNKGSEEPTEKANKVKRIKTTLMLGENSLIEPGPVNIYCRIAIPETGKVLTMGSGDTYSFVHNGQRLQYSCKTVVNYNNKAENITMDWDLMSDDKAIKGQYSVQLYTDDQFLGECYFTLK